MPAIMTIASITPKQIRMVRLLIKGAPVDKSIISRRRTLAEEICIRCFNLGQPVMRGMDL